MQEILQQSDSTQVNNVRATNHKVVAQVGWAAAVLRMTTLAEACASRAAGSQDMGPRTWADLTRAQQQIALNNSRRSCLHDVLTKCGDMMLVAVRSSVSTLLTMDIGVLVIAWPNSHRHEITAKEAVHTAWLSFSHKLSCKALCKQRLCFL